MYAIRSYYVYYQTGLPASSHPQVADLDDDGLPEIFISSTSGLSLLEHDDGKLAARFIAISNLDGDSSYNFV